MKKPKFIHNKWFLRAIAVAVIGAAVYFVVRTVVRDWAVISEYEWSLKWWLLLASIAIGCAASFVNAKVMQRIMKAFGARVPFSRFGFLFMAANFGRYVPGKVAQIAGLLVFMKREGVPRTVTFASMVVYQGLLILVAGIVGISLVGPEIITKAAPGISIWVVFAAAIVGIVLTIPSIMERIVNLGLGLLKRERIVYDLSIRDWAVAFIALVIGWILFGIAFAVMNASITGLEIAQFPYACGAFVLAFMIGWLVLIAPGGLGVREGILLLILAAIYPSGIAGLIATVARVWIFIIEAVSLGIAALIFKFCNKDSVSEFNPVSRNQPMEISNG